jgi:hypothetical protein
MGGEEGGTRSVSPHQARPGHLPEFEGALHDAASDGCRLITQVLRGSRPKLSLLLPAGSCVTPGSSSSCVHTTGSSPQ